MTDEAASTPGPSTAATPGRKPVVLLVGALLGLVLGYVVLILVQGGIALIWTTVPDEMGGTPAWYVIAVPLAAGVLVFAIRRFLGDHGHSPLGGITVSPLTPRGYLDAILAIAASLLGGIVLGPEVAMVSTGAVIGGLVAKATGADAKRVVAASAAGSLLALFVKPILSGSLSLGGTSDLVVADIAWAVPTALLTALVVAVGPWGRAG